jgi:hypothetical protein
MTGLHDRFTRWLAEGGRGELSRDVMLHASACDECLRAAAAIDALLGVDLAAAPAPPVLAGARAATGIPVAVRALLGTLAASAIVVATVIGAGSWLRPGGRGEVGAGGSPTPAGAVLAGGPSPTSSPSATSTASASASASESPSPAASAAPAGPPLTPPVTPPPATAAPTAVAIPTATSVPTPRVTPTPTATATPIPTPTPVPPTPVPTPTPIPPTPTPVLPTLPPPP